MTEPNFSQRLADLIKYDGLDVKDIELLRIGRHFRLNDNVKLIVGRNAQDNAQLLDVASDKNIILNVDDIPGPVAILPSTVSADNLKLAAEISARYCDSVPGEYVNISIEKSKGPEYLKVLPKEHSEIEKMRI